MKLCMHMKGMSPEMVYVLIGILIMLFILMLARYLPPFK
jgi:hypothetical protein